MSDRQVQGTRRTGVASTRLHGTNGHWVLKKSNWEKRTIICFPLFHLFPNVSFLPPKHMLVFTQRTLCTHLLQSSCICDAYVTLLKRAAQTHEQPTNKYTNVRQTLIYWLVVSNILPTVFETISQVRFIKWNILTTRLRRPLNNQIGFQVSFETGKMTFTEKSPRWHILSYQGLLNVPPVLALTSSKKWGQMELGKLSPVLAFLM